MLLPYINYPRFYKIKMQRDKIESRGHSDYEMNIEKFTCNVPGQCQTGRTRYYIPAMPVSKYRSTIINNIPDTFLY